MSPPRSVRVAAAALVLNAAWERAHWPLYECEFRIARWLRASVADAALTAASSALAARVAPERPHAYWAVLTATLTATAVGIELYAARRTRWCYRQAMPRVAGVGLSPLAQLPVAGVIAATLAVRP